MKIPKTPIAVSYTHLDVYKRQEIHSAINIQIAKRPRKLPISKTPFIAISTPGSSVWRKSRYFEKVPKAIPRNNIDMVFISFLLLDIGFSAFLISFKKFIIITFTNSDLLLTFRIQIIP